MPMGSASYETIIRERICRGLKLSRLIEYSELAEREEFGSKPMAKEHMARIDLLTREAHPFVMTIPADIRGPWTMEDLDALPVPLALPFESCSFELLGQASITRDQAGGYECWCVVFVELDPEHFLAQRLLTSPSPDGVQIEVRSERGRYDDNTVIAMLLRFLMSQLHGGSVATEHVRDRIKTRTGSVKIRPIVHIRSTRSEGSIGVFGGPLNWQHKWEVRGHWRKCDMIGKDRAGNYCVSGFTWVLPHEKGTGPLVKKTRVKS